MAGTAAGTSPATSAGAGTAGQAGSASANPFWEVTNLFAQANKSGSTAATLLGASTVAGGSNINPGNFLRGLRLLVRTSTIGVSTATYPVLATNQQANDYPYNIFQNLGLLNVDGSEILYNVIGGYAWAQAHRFGRPWLADPNLSYDFCASPIAPSFTIFLQPEVRQQLGALENTDTRSQYNWTQTINSTTNIYSTAPGTAPTITVTPYVDMWAQPDSTDLEQVSNQQVPNGVNLQSKTRHQTFTMNSAASDNFILSSLTGNAIRFMLVIVRDSNLARQDWLTTNVQWQLDQRNLSTFATDNIFQWAEDFYRYYGGVTRPCGVYPFPRFYSPGSLYGQGWLYTANSTALSWESNTLSTAGSNLPGTIELLQEEIYATGPVDPSLIDL